MIETLFKEFPDTLQRQYKSLKKGDILFKQGDDIKYLYFIEKGKIKLTRNTIDGHPVVLHIGQQGEAIAEASLFSEQYHCSAIADLACRLSFVKKTELLSFLQNNPQTMLKLLAIFSSQIRNLRAINEIKNIRSANERVLTFIRMNMNKNNKMNLNVSLKDIAHKIGLAHETFYRELKHLESNGKLQRHSDYIKLL